MPTVAGVTAAVAVAGAVVRDGAPPAPAGVTLLVHVHGDGSAERMVLLGVDDRSGRAVLLPGPARLPGDPGRAAGARPTGPALARDLGRTLGIDIDRVMVVDDDLLSRVLRPAAVPEAAPRLDAPTLRSWAVRLTEPGAGRATGAVDGRLDGFLAAASSRRARVAPLPEVPSSAPAAAGDPAVLDVGRARQLVSRMLPSAVRHPGAAGA